MSVSLVFLSGNYADPAQDGPVVDAIATVPIGVLQSVIPSYLYQQYADDADLQAFVDAYNTLAQSYLAWFNSTPLAVYTSPSVSGPLLDWIANGIYGIERPVFSSLVTEYIAGLNSSPVNAFAVNGSQYLQSGTATVASDDYYKRTLTWFLYVGDGRYFNATVLRLKVARFLYGVNGTDITLSQAQSVSIASTGPTTYTITIPPGESSTYFAQAFAQGSLAIPFMLSGTVVIS
jgi:hypothetical protein